jgi:hypothetical protein
VHKESIPNTLSFITSNVLRLVGHVACVGEKRNSYKVIVRKLEGRRPFGRQAKMGE